MRSTARYLAGSAVGVALIAAATVGTLAAEHSTAGSAGSGTTVTTAAASTAASGTSASGTSEASGSATTTAASTTSGDTYKNGTYTATGSYNTPDGSETITVTVTLADDAVTATNATGSATRGTSAQFQDAFLANFAAQVVGKNIDDVAISSISGASLTAQGFDQAIVQIRSQADAS